MQASNLQEAQDELTNLMTVMYMIIQEALNDQEEFGEVCEQLRMSSFCQYQVPELTYA